MIPSRPLPASLSLQQLSSLELGLPEWDLLVASETQNIFAEDHAEDMASSSFSSYSHVLLSGK